MTGGRLRVIFMGTPDFVVPTLQSLMKAHEVVAVYTQPPRAKGRGQRAAEKTPVQAAAEQAGIAVYTPADFTHEEDAAAFRAHRADIAVVAAYGLLLPQHILEAPRHGCVNIHPSLLPRWRGSAPIQFAIWKGDEITGVSVMKLVKKMDAGPVIAQESVPIGRADFLALNETLWAAGTRLLMDALAGLQENGTLPATPQDEGGVTFTHMLQKDHGRIDWSQGAADIDRQVRALNPWPGTWCLLPDGKRMKILQAKPEAGQGLPGEVLDDGRLACGAGALHLLSVQPEGKKPMDGAAALNGGYLKPGMRLS